MAEPASERTPPDDTTENLRERAEAAVEDWFNHLADDDEPTVEQIGQGVAAAVLAALAGDPGDLPAQDVERHLERRIAAQQATIGRQSDEVERLRAELANRKAKTEGILIDFEQWKARAQLAEAGRDALKAELAVVKRNWKHLSDSLANARKEIAGRKEHAERLRAELAEVTEQRDIRRQDCDDLAEQSHERLQRAARAESERDALKAAIAALLTAQGRMLDGWAEGNEDRRRELWRRLHREADRVRDALDGAHSPAAAPTGDGSSWLEDLAKAGPTIWAAKHEAPGDDEEATDA